MSEFIQVALSKIWKCHYIFSMNNSVDIERATYNIHPLASFECLFINCKHSPNSQISFLIFSFERKFY